MKFVISPDKFKGSLSGFEFCDAVEEGLLMAIPDAEIVKLPLADGGDGTMEVIHHYLGGEKIEIIVQDPLFRKIKASYLYVSAQKMAYIEMAEASGLKLLKKEEQNCRYTTTFGTGELILDAIANGAKNIMLGIGGSSTNDCGIGMATALGYEFLDANRNVVKPLGENLSLITEIKIQDVYPNLAKIKFEVACDVRNPLHGVNGAAKIYGKQKGASEQDIEFLDQGLVHIGRLMEAQFKKEVNSIEGAGAAGGMGAGVITFLNATLTSGIELIKGIAHMDAHVKNADWIITGEGRLDNQTLSGKTINGVMKSAQNANIPVAAFCGAMDISEDDLQQLGITYATAITHDILTLEVAIKNSYKNLKFSVFNFAKLLKSIEDKK